MAAFNRKAAGQLKAACEFCNSAVPIAADIEVLFRKLEEEKTDREWTFDDLSSFQKSLRGGMTGIAQTLNDKDVKELKAQIGSYLKPGELVEDLDHRILLPEKRSIKRTTDDPQKEICITCEGHKPFDKFWGPLIILKIFELIDQLPKTTLRVCASSSCKNLFVSSHKAKRYCSVTCRNYENNRASRLRLKERLKDAD